MNLDLGPDEIALRDAIRELCRGRFPMERVREMTTVDRAVWKELGEAGVFSMRLPEAEGGAGLGMAEASIVFQELGRALVPGPLVATHLAAGWVDGAATGEAVVGLVLEPDRQVMRDGALVLQTGAMPRIVEHYASLDALLRVSHDIQVLPVTELDASPVEPLDPLTPIHRVQVPLEGDEGRFDDRRFLEEAKALTAALLSGIASQTAEMAVAYAKDREQFGRPIGSFQAVKHICADAFVRAEVARAAVDLAAVALSDPKFGPDRQVDGALLLAGEYAVANAKACIQVYGGMGFTWEADPHLYLKRATVLASRLGATTCAERVAASL